MKKKCMAILLSAATVVSGVGGTIPVGAAENDELTEIVWQWPSVGNVGSGFQAVEDALNAMLEPDIGVHVTLEPVNYSELANNTVLTVSSGEQLDLCLSIFSGVGSLVSDGLIEPLDDYIDNEGKDIKEICGTALSGGYYAGSLYGVPVAYVQGESYGYIARTDLLDKYGITIDIANIAISKI